MATVIYLLYLAILILCVTAFYMYWLLHCRFSSWQYNFENARSHHNVRYSSLVSLRLIWIDYRQTVHFWCDSVGLWCRDLSRMTRKPFLLPDFLHKKLFSENGCNQCTRNDWQRPLLEHNAMWLISLSFEWWRQGTTITFYIWIQFSLGLWICVDSWADSWQTTSV